MIYQKLAIVAVGAALSLTLMEVHPAQAASVTYDFTLDVTSGSSQGNQYNGSFSFDDSRLTGPFDYAGIGNLYYTFPTNFNLDFDGRSYGLTQSTPGLPTTQPLTGLFFPSQTTPLPLPMVELVARSDSDIYRSQLNINQNSFFVTSQSLTTGTVSSSTGTVSYSLISSANAVPEPENSAGVLIFLGLGWFMRKKIPFKHA